jgi:hypothetical protein
MSSRMQSGRTRSCRWGGALAAMLAVLSSGPAGAANWLEQNFYLFGPRYDGVLPACDGDWVLSKLSARFSHKESAFWSSDLTIVGIDHVRETAFRPGPPNTIPRRFCSGIALISNGTKHPVHYSISEDTGMIGASWGIEWCVEGLDRNWAYNPRCKMARP